jgi:hypothetical protein
MRSILAFIVISAAAYSGAQSLQWKPVKDHPTYSCIYGQVTVLLDEPGTYYGGADWWESHPAAGATGIQSEDKDHKMVMFSVWPTDKGDNAFPEVGQTNPHLGHTWARNDVHGAHCDADYAWQAGHTFQFYATKGFDQRTGAVIVSLYFYDEVKQSWEGEGRILSPIDGKKNVDNFEWLTSSLSNLRAKNDPNRDQPRLALYRLWAGSGPSDLHMITTATGRGDWGTMNGAFFLAIGTNVDVDHAIFGNLAPGTRAVRGDQKARLEIPAEGIPPSVVRALQELG